MAHYHPSLLHAYQSSFNAPVNNAGAEFLAKQHQWLRKERSQSPENASYLGLDRPPKKEKAVPVSPPICWIGFEARIFGDSSPFLKTGSFLKSFKTYAWIMDVLMTCVRHICSKTSMTNRSQSNIWKCIQPDSQDWWWDVYRIQHPGIYWVNFTAIHQDTPQCKPQKRGKPAWTLYLILYVS